MTVFTGQGAVVSSAPVGGSVEFFDTSSAGNGTFINNGGTVSGAFGARVWAQETGSLGNAILIANPGTNGGQGGLIQLSDDSTGGTSRVELFGNGHLDIGPHNLPGATVGSIEGNGLVFLGNNRLTVGANSLSTVFSGVISGAGSVTKVGTGKLTLSGINTYTGQTTVNSGTLSLQKNRTGSQTGLGPVVVNAGMLSGNGKAGGNVTIGNGSGPRGIFDPGGIGAGFLTVGKKLTFKSDGTYMFQLDSNNLTADKGIAKGATINVGALFAATDLGITMAPPGFVFTVISNISQTPIAGVFSNLPDGGIIAIGNAMYQANYHGGTSGRDLTLTAQ